MILAIIPARAGSKRIPRKNIRDFHGKPIIQWSIETANASGVFDEVMVSTDDNEIADISRRAGAAVPFMRSVKAADDYATTVDVLLEVLSDYERDGVTVELACCIYPTAPFVKADDLIDGLEQMRAAGFDSLFPVARFDYPIWRSLAREDSGRLSINYPEHLNSRSQDLPDAYHDAGQWYWFNPVALKRDKVLMGSNSGSVVLPAARVQDIDTEEDWHQAELMFEWQMRRGSVG